MHAVRARRIVTMSPEAPCIEDGILLSDDQGIILDVGRYRTLSKGCPCPVEDLGAVTLVPGLINAHSHLEISQAHGRTVLGRGFEPWVRSLLALSLHHLEPADLAEAADQLASCSTAHVAEITSRAPSLVASALTSRGIGYTLLFEFFGFKRRDNTQLKWPVDLFSTLPAARISAAGHALYSTHPLTLQQAKVWNSSRNRPFSIHLAEHMGEVEVLATGRGPFAELLSRRNLLPKGYTPPGISPVAYAERLGLLDDCTLAVHCVHLTGEDIETLSRTETNVCLCPRSNELIGVGRSPWEELLGAGITICLGTDSLASNEDLNLWNEALYLLEHTRIPLPLFDLLSMVTVNPARALMLHGLGSLVPGKFFRYAVLPKELEPFCP
jgi:aminodeoxyfutalosine deaminase